MKTHISIMAHGEARETFKRHFGFWHKQVNGVDEDMLIWFPDRKAFEVPGIQIQAVGKPEHAGNVAIKRFRYILEHMNSLNYDRYIFHEYDSLSLEPLGDDFNPDVAGNFFEDKIENMGGFRSPIFPHPPLSFSKKGLNKIVSEIRHMPELEGGFWDRWLGLAAHRSGVHWHSFLQNGTGFAHNTVEPEHFHSLKEAVAAGAVHLHGIKSPEALKVALEARESVAAIKAARETLKKYGVES